MTVPTKAAFKLEAHEGEVMCVQWDYPGRYFATAGTDRKIKVWEISKYHQARQHLISTYTPNTKFEPYKMFFQINIGTF